MIVRIVKMEFRKEEVDTFLQLFDERKEKIRHFPGCNYLELLQGDGPKDNIFMTYSYWDSEEDLNNYRYSGLFKDTWDKTKVLFSKQAEAITMNKYIEMK